MFSVTLNAAGLSGYLSFLQKLQEILNHNQMEIASLELEICSSEKNVAAIKNLKSTACISKHTTTNKLRLVSECSKNFSYADGREEEEKEMNRLEGKKLLTDSKIASSHEIKKLLVANSSRSIECRDFQKGKQVLQDSEVKEISERLRSLEQESERMKRELVEHMEERRILVSQIYQLFQTIENFPQLRKTMEGETTFNRTFFFSHCNKSECIVRGLAEVLLRHSSSRIVTRDRRTKALVLRGVTVASCLR
ncbi:hypothetical protein K2173_009336 [Erythroxylum novogranatense]|uniref:Uncharacterized protein n=1 Tax=Erythroxylum novogranatense TaxID=1862640 RepID=A0AAV8U3T0_9ROSI|nr:hypothetical protein K2173_009336 [Erythroxylum novogranatense]